MNRFKRLSLTVLLASLMIFSVACGGGTANPPAGEQGNAGTEGATYSFKLAHITPEIHPWHVVAEKFKEELENKSDGRMTVEIYPAGQLGPEADQMQQIQGGSIDFGFFTAAYLTSRSEAFSAWFAPYLFDSVEEANAVRHEEVSKKILATLDEQGVKGLEMLFPTGNRMMLFKDKEVTTPEQLKGLKLRVTPSPVLQDFYRSLGVSPESIPLPDVYQAVQTGVIDGMDMDLDAAISNNYAEVTKYGLLSNHMVWPVVAIANEKMFAGLSAEDQKIVQDALNVAADYGAGLIETQETEFKEKLTAAGMNLYEMNKELFAPYIEQFDETYKAKDPLIKEFIETFR